jgi:hypothetical protein
MQTMFGYHVINLKKCNSKKKSQKSDKCVVY